LFRTLLNAAAKNLSKEQHSIVDWFAMLNKTPLSTQRISARDRRRAAIYAAGHVVVGRHLGFKQIEARIRKTQSFNIYQRVWADSFRYDRLQVPKNKRGLPKKHKLWLVAVAGAVAEACWDGGAIEEFCDNLEHDNVGIRLEDGRLCAGRTITATFGCR
jgi:hypothetical protein